MSTNTLRPGLTAAMAAGRALLAAGWRYDSTSPMADDTTIRTLLHPTGREIHARTVDGGEQTDLTMTGLTLEQVAGAVAGAGLAGKPEVAEPAGDDDAAAAALVEHAAELMGTPVKRRNDHTSTERKFHGVTLQPYATTRASMARYHAEQSYAGAVEPDGSAS